MHSALLFSDYPQRLELALYKFLNVISQIPNMI